MTKETKDKMFFGRALRQDSRVISEDPCSNVMIKPRVPDSRPEKDTVMLFDYALLSLWAERYLPPKEHEALLELTELFRAEMGVVFKENKWMGKKSKEKAIQKLEKMKFNVGLIPVGPWMRRK